METSRSNIKDTSKQRNTRANLSPVEYVALSDWTGTWYERTVHTTMIELLTSLARQPLLLKKRERGSGESCTSGLSPFRNFQTLIRLQHAACDNSRTQGM